MGNGIAQIRRRGADARERLRPLRFDEVPRPYDIVVIETGRIKGLGLMLTEREFVRVKNNRLVLDRLSNERVLMRPAKP
jgi:hypothetical protein